MQSQGVFHFFLFVVFFSVGASALGGAVLCNDLILYCRNERLVEEAEQSLARLDSLNQEYDGLLGELKRDPNILKRIAPATLGTQPADPNAIYPKAKARDLAIARRAMVELAGPKDLPPAVPPWLERCSEPSRRLGLFVAGAGLVLISLVFFTPKQGQET